MSLTFFCSSLGRGASRFSCVRIKLLAMALIGLLGSGCGGGGGGDDALGDVPSGCADWPDLYELPAADSHSNIKSVIVINDCSLIVAGYDRSTHASEPEGDSRGFIRKLELNGDGEISEQWTYWLNTEGTDAVLNLTQSGREFLFLGVTTGTLPGQQSHGKKDVVAGRLDALGSLVSIAQLGTERPNVPLKWLRLSTGELFLVGSDEPFVPTNYVDRWEDPWIASVTEHETGFSVNWWQNADTDQQDIYSAAASFGSYLLLARTTFSGSLAGVSIEALDSGGAVTWQRQLSRSAHDHISEIAVDGDDGLLAFGTTYQQLGDKTFGGGDYFLQRMNVETGDENWTRQWGDDQLNWAANLVSVDQGWVLTGESSASLYPWELEVFSTEADATPDLLTSTLIGKSTQVEDTKSTSKGLIIAGHFDRDSSTTVGYIAGSSY